MNLRLAKNYLNILNSNPFLQTMPGSISTMVLSPFRQCPSEVFTFASEGARLIFIRL